jgi:hypothetical protein
MNKEDNIHSQTRSRRIATPISGFLPGNRHVAPITLE